MTPETWDFNKKPPAPPNSETLVVTENITIPQLQLKIDEAKQQNQSFEIKIKNFSADIDRAKRSVITFVNQLYIQECYKQILILQDKIKENDSKIQEWSNQLNSTS